MIGARALLFGRDSLLAIASYPLSALEGRETRAGLCLILESSVVYPTALLTIVCTYCITQGVGVERSRSFVTANSLHVVWFSWLICSGRANITFKLVRVTSWERGRSRTVSLPSIYIYVHLSIPLSLCYQYCCVNYFWWCWCCNARSPKSLPLSTYSVFVLSLCMGV